ncbi:MAG: cytochrome c peroxidase [bacterium]
MPRVSLVFTLTLMVLGNACGGRAKAPSPVLNAFEAGMDSLSIALAGFDSALDDRDIAHARTAFRTARAAYKHQEALLAYYSPSTVSILNGPVQDDDEGPAQPLGEVAAFQRIEARLFVGASFADSDRIAAHRNVSTMREAVTHFRALTGFLVIIEPQVLDALRAELARVSTLSLAGVDSDDSGDAVVESAAAVEGMVSVARVASKVTGTKASSERWTTLIHALAATVARLRVDTNATTMDRLDFLANAAEPAGRAMLHVREEMGPMDIGLRLVWRSTASTVFQRNAFDPTAYAPDFALHATDAAVRLGERLFNDPLLSGPRTRSCASCHIPQLAFTDGVARHAAMGAGSAQVARNTPTLLNVALHPTFFADGRAANLEDQIGAVLASPTEMASSPELAARRLSADSTYRAAFAMLIPSQKAGEIAQTSVRAVIATYVRSLVKLDSRFDAAVRGNGKAFSPKERHGFTIFMGKARCGTCHFAPLFSGVLPPMFTTSEPEIIGVPTRADTMRAVIDKDPGRAGIDNIPQHLHAFKVPTLRNVARTAPYMHNGTYASLEQVVDFYNRGGGAGVGARVPAQTLSTRPLHLSAIEQQDLVAFLRSLTDSTFEQIPQSLRANPAHNP